MNHTCKPEGPYRLVIEGDEHYVIPHHIATPDACESFLARISAALADCLAGRVSLGRTALQLHVAPLDVDEVVTVELQPCNGFWGSVWLVDTAGSHSELPLHPEVAAGVVLARLGLG